MAQRQVNIEVNARTAKAKSNLNELDRALSKLQAKSTLNIDTSRLDKIGGQASVLARQIEQQNAKIADGGKVLLSQQASLANRTNRTFERLNTDRLKVVTRELSNWGQQVDSFGNKIVGVTVGAVAGLSAAISGGVRDAFNTVATYETSNITLGALGFDRKQVQNFIGAIDDYVNSDVGKLFQGSDTIDLATQLVPRTQDLNKALEYVKVIQRSNLLTNDENTQNILTQLMTIGNDLDAGVKPQLNSVKALSRLIPGLSIDMIREVNTFDELMTRVAEKAPQALAEGYADTFKGLQITTRSGLRGLGNELLGIENREFAEGGLGSRLKQFIRDFNVELRSPELKGSVRDFSQVLIGGLDSIQKNLPNIGKLVTAFISGFTTSLTSASRVLKPFSDLIGRTVGWEKFIEITGRLASNWLKLTVALKAGGAILQGPLKLFNAFQKLEKLNIGKGSGIAGIGQIAGTTANTGGAFSKLNSLSNTIIKGAIAVSAIFGALVIAGRSLKDFYREMPTDFFGLQERILSFGLIVGELSVLSGIAGKFNTHILTGIVSIAGVLGSLYIGAKAIKSFDKEMPSNFLGLQKKIGSFSLIIGEIALLAGAIGAIDIATLGITAGAKALGFATIATVLAELAYGAEAINKFNKIKIDSSTTKKITAFVDIIKQFGSEAFDWNTLKAGLAGIPTSFATGGINSLIILGDNLMTFSERTEGLTPERVRQSMERIRVIFDELKKVFGGDIFGGDIFENVQSFANSFINTGTYGNLIKIIESLININDKLSSLNVNIQSYAKLSSAFEMLRFIEQEAKTLINEDIGSAISEFATTTLDNWSTGNILTIIENLTKIDNALQKIDQSEESSKNAQAGFNTLASLFGALQQLMAGNVIQDASTAISAILKDDTIGRAKTIVDNLVSIDSAIVKLGENKTKDIDPGSIFNKPKLFLFNLMNMLNEVVTHANYSVLGRVAEVTEKMNTAFDFVGAFIPKLSTLANLKSALDSTNDIDPGAIFGKPRDILFHLNNFLNEVANFSGLDTAEEAILKITHIQSLINQLAGLQGAIAPLNGEGFTIENFMANINTIKTGIRSIGELIAEITALNFEVGVTFMTELLNGMLSVDIEGPVLNKVDSLRNSLASRSGSFFAVGQSLGQSIANGIRSVDFSSIGASITSSISSAVSNARSQLSGLSAERSALGLSHGGLVPNYYAKGGLAGSIFRSRGTDTIPAMLTPGEYTHRKKAVDFWGTDFMDAINNNSVFEVGNLLNDKLTTSKSIQNITNDNRQNNAKITNNFYGEGMSRNGFNRQKRDLRGI